jgi:methionine synthase II (cobalamin-independent)
VFATFAGGYARGPLPAQPDLLGDAERDLRAGLIDEVAYRAVADEVVREVLAEMAVVRLGVVGDGGIRARNRVLPLIEGLDGLSAGAEAALPDGEPATRPLVTGPIRWTQPMTVRDWQFADEASETWVKQTFVGPYSLAALAEPTTGARRRRIAEELGEALNAEIRALVDAGCPIVEVDEPFVDQAGAAADLEALASAHGRLTAGLDDPTAVHLSLGLWGGTIDPAAHRTLIDLPYSSYLVDVLPGASAWRFIAAVPPERGIVVGAVDAHTMEMEEIEVLVWAMAWAAQGGRGQQRVGIAPNGSLTFLDRHFAHRKAQLCGEAVVIANAGPLQDVAEALDDDPLRSRMRRLRTMAEAREVARSQNAE